MNKKLEKKIYNALVTKHSNRNLTSEQITRLYDRVISEVVKMITDDEKEFGAIKFDIYGNPELIETISLEILDEI